MKQLLFILFLTLTTTYAHCNNNSLYHRLDSTLAHRNDYVDNKEKQLQQIKLSTKYVHDTEGKLHLYESLAKGYLAYVYDSAMTYTKKGINLARQTRHSTYEQKFLSLRANLLISRGFYAEAKEILDSLGTESIGKATNLSQLSTNRELISNYYQTLYQLYNNWEAYCESNEFSHHYRQLKLGYLRQAIQAYPQKDATYYYLMGELSFFAGKESKRTTHDDNVSAQKQTISFYQKALSMESTSHRLYAMAAFALSDVYAQIQSKMSANSKEKQQYQELQEKYLILAAISDIESATKENLALQNIALFLYQSKRGDLKKAQEYINISLEDAANYNNRLRRIEIASKLQLIKTAYTDQIKSRNIGLIITLVAILILLMAIAFSALFIKKKNRLLNQKKEELVASAEKMQHLNQQLHAINEQLTNTNRRREDLVKVYIDLCYKYIERVSKLRTLAIRKIKANQQKELLSTLSSSQTTDKENQNFLQQFDKAFLTLYPSFVDELNELLFPQTAISQKRDYEMSPILRVAALIRLGITESSKIAGILSYSPQTIYNYRSTLKNNALDKEHFEENLQKLCTVIH